MPNGQPTAPRLNPTQLASWLRIRALRGCTAATAYWLARRAPVIGGTVGALGFADTSCRDTGASW